MGSPTPGARATGDTHLIIPVVFRGSVARRRHRARRVSRIAGLCRLAIYEVVWRRHVIKFSWPIFSMLESCTLKHHLELNDISACARSR